MSGARPSGTGSRASTEPASRLGPSGFGPARGDFTPGPWKLVPCPCGNSHCKRQQLANVGTFYTGTGFEPADANLVAAAPELYEALLEARIAAAADIEEAECGDDGRYASFLPVFVERLAKIDAALSKARGEHND